MNKLSDEKSPYLLQHASNPVHWLPWGDEAFETALREDKPILVSIGYATCHWCHVMERECFENPAIAGVMNRHLVCVKVDREERPDVDRLYMTAVQAMTGQGGWPLNVFLTPTGKVFLGGTYFPPSDRGGRPGWPRLVERIAAAWKNPGERQSLERQGEELNRAVAGFLTGPTPVADLDAEGAVSAAFNALKESFDPARGGFSGAPKFPMPVNQQFLLRFAARAEALADPRGKTARDMAVRTLRALAAGGICDQLGGGFHRYSTDDRWHLPHFEKMLYDNAQLAVNFLEAHQLTGDSALARTARSTLDYLVRDLGNAPGGFYSAEDADSRPADPLPGADKKEGAFYVWTWAALSEILGAEADLFARAHGVQPDGNVADGTGEFAGENVLFRARSDGDLAADTGGTIEDIARRLAASRLTLFDRRRSRPRPFLDDKILTGWNGLALSALAKGHAILGEDRYREAAVRAAEFLKNRLWDAAGGRLYRRWRDGERAVAGQADDHAFLIQGLVDLYEATFDISWLRWAETLAEVFLRTFVDRDSGVVHATPAHHDPRLPFRARDEGDNVEPGASSVAVAALQRLGRWRARADFTAAAGKIADALRGRAAEAPRAFPGFLSAEVVGLCPKSELIIAGRPGNEATRRLLAEARRVFRPDLLVVLADQGEGQAALAERLPHLAGLHAPVGRARAYFCREGACEMPLDTPEALRARLTGFPRW